MDFQTGEIVATTKILLPAKGIFEGGPTVWAGTLGTVTRIGNPLALVDFGALGTLWVHPVNLEGACGSSEDDKYQTYLEREVARLEGEIARLQNSLASQLKPTGARLAHAGSGNGS